MDLLTEIDSKIKIIEKLGSAYDRMCIIRVFIILIVIGVFIMIIKCIGILIDIILEEKRKSDIILPFTDMVTKEKKKEEDKNIKNIVCIGIISVIIIAITITCLSISIKHKRDSINSNVIDILQMIDQDEKCSNITVESSKEYFYTLLIKFTYNNAKDPVIYTIKNVPVKVREAAIRYNQILDNHRIIKDNELESK